MLRPRVSGPRPPAASVRVRVTRDLGLFDVTMTAVGAMVGAAIFLLVGAAYTVSGPLVLASLGVAAFVAALAGMAYAELASGRPDASGGAYVWVRSALPSPSGFLSGWLSWGGHIAASGLSALGLGVFLVEFVRPSDFASFFGPNPIEVGLVALAVLALSAVPPLARIHLPGRAPGRLTFGEALLLLLVARLGIASLFQPGPPPGFAAGAPGSSLPTLLRIRIVSMYGALISNLTAAIKTSFSMARDGLLPGMFARIGGREVPPAAVAVTLVVAGVLVFLTIETIAIIASLAFLGLFAFVHASVIALRRRERRSGPGFRVPFVPAVPMVAIALNLALGAVLWNFPARRDSPIPPGILATSLGAAWIAIGLTYHVFRSRRGAVPPARAASGSEVRDILATAEDRVELERYRVFLPLREFTDEALVELGARIAKARNAELSLLHVVEIPRNLPPKAIRFRYVDERIRGLQRLTRIGEHLGVDTRPVVKIGHKVYEIILDTIREEAVNLLVMGWRGQRVEGDRRVLGSNIDYLIENAPCDVIVFETQCFRKPLRRIVILTSPTWGLAGIDDLALILAPAGHPVIEGGSRAG